MLSTALVPSATLTNRAETTMTDEHQHRSDRPAADTGPRLAPLPEDS
ncbi:hypothetical protein [Streptomyces sp. NPDC001153]